MPGAIENLVLVNASPRFLAAPGWPYGTAAVLLRRLRGAPGTRSRQGHRRLHEPAGARHAATHRRARAARSCAACCARTAQAHYEALANGLERLKNGDLRAALTQVRVPTLVIGGSHDRIIQPERLAGAGRPGRAAATWNSSEAAHVPFLSHPKRFAQLVEEFLDG